MKAKRVPPEFLPLPDGFPNCATHFERDGGVTVFEFDSVEERLIPNGENKWKATSRWEEKVKGNLSLKQRITHEKAIAKRERARWQERRETSWQTWRILNSENFRRLTAATEELHAPKKLKSDPERLAWLAWNHRVPLIYRKVPGATTNTIADYELDTAAMKAIEENPMKVPKVIRYKLAEWKNDGDKVAVFWATLKRITNRRLKSRRPINYHFWSRFAKFAQDPKMTAFKAWRLLCDELGEKEFTARGIKENRPATRDALVAKFGEEIVGKDESLMRFMVRRGIRFSGPGGDR